MRFVSLAVAIFLVASAASARPYDEIMKDAAAAFEAEDYPTAASALDEAQMQRPYSLYLTRNRVLARILADRMPEAIAIADEVAERGLVLETPPNEAFDRMRADPAFASVAARMEENAKPVSKARLMSEFAETGLLPEAVSKRKGRVLIGSVRTGEIRDASKNLKPFAKLSGGVFDIEQRGKRVYAAVNNQLAYGGDKSNPHSEVVVLDAKKGAVIAIWPTGIGDSIIGDIEVASDGRIFASDSGAPKILDLPRLKKDGMAAALRIEDPRFVNLQGIALDEKNHRLFVADYLAGLFVVDTKTRKVTAIGNPTDAHLGGIDGLYLHDGDLIGIQNGTSPQRIVRVRLDEFASTAIGLDVFERAAPDWNEPTHGYVEGDTFNYIATSNWPAYNDDGDVKDDKLLKPLRLMSVSLSER